MKTVIIDYDRVISGGNPAARPLVHLTGKFLQIMIDDTEFLLLSSRELTPYHSDILERFCGERDIKGSYDGDRKRFNVEEPSLKVKGGGKFDIDTVNKCVRLYDDSMAYGKFDAEGLKDKVLRMKGLAGYEVVIE